MLNRFPAVCLLCFCRMPHQMPAKSGGLTLRSKFRLWSRSTSWANATDTWARPKEASHSASMARRTATGQSWICYPIRLPVKRQPKGIGLALLAWETLADGSIAGKPNALGLA